MKLFHPPYLYCVTIIGNIVVKVFTLQSQRHGVLQSEYLVWGIQGWSSWILERKLTAHILLQYRPR